MGEKHEREVVEGEGVVIYYNPRRYDPRTRKAGGYGFLHRSDRGCGADPRTCRDEEHRVHFSVFQVQWIGVPFFGTPVKFRANSPRREGDSPSAFRLEHLGQKKERPEKAIPGAVTHGR